MRTRAITGSLFAIALLSTSVSLGGGIAGAKERPASSSGPGYVLVAADLSSYAFNGGVDLTAQ